MLHPLFSDLNAVRLNNVIYGGITPLNIMCVNSEDANALVLIDSKEDDYTLGHATYSKGRHGDDQDLQAASITLCDLINCERYKSRFLDSLNKLRDKIYELANGECKVRSTVSLTSQLVGLAKNPKNVNTCIQYLKG